MTCEGSLLAAPEGAVFMVVAFPPDAVMVVPRFDFAAAGAEHAKEAPRHPRNLRLELDDGKAVTLNHGDTLVQHGRPPRLAQSGDRACDRVLRHAGRADRLSWRKPGPWNGPASTGE